MDYLIRGLLKNRKIRFLAANTTNITSKITALRNTSDVVSVAIGRLISVGAMFGYMNKEDKATVSLRVQGNGKIGLMIVDANTKGEVRAYIENPLVGLPLINNQLDVAKAIGQGMITVVKSFGLKHSFHSEVELQTSQIGDDFSYYFNVSEQTPSLVAVSTTLKKTGKIKNSGGFIIQLMPDVSEEDILFIEGIAAKLNNVAKFFDQYSDLQTMMESIFGELEFVESFPLKYRCNCSKNRLIKAISTLKEEEILAMINEDKHAEIVCNYCNKTHLLTIEDLKKSLKSHK